MGAILSTLFWAVAAVGLYAGYKRILPKPLPGIPYNRDAVNKTFGDIPEMMRYVLRTGRMFCWFTSLTTRHNSAIIQAFIKPGSLPWVVVTDPFESQDILLRRKEFDRSGFFGELIGGILPEQHIQFISSDPRFKNNRNLINHLMAPTFISTVLGPRFYDAISTMVQVWDVKCDKAKGRPFHAHHDITYMALDTIFAAMFGHPNEDSITTNRLKAMKEWSPKAGDIPDSLDGPVPFPDAELPAIFSAALTLAGSVTDTQLSPHPRATSWVLRQLPYMKKATAIKDQYIGDRVDESVSKIKKGDENPQTALHSVLLRERDVAAKEGRLPQYHKRAIADEFFGFMLAGHDTSATTVAWGVKFLTDHPEVQERLRSDLRAALPEAYKEKRAPSYQELSKAHIPYLDAVVEEILRHSNTIAFVVRQALQDTTVLGHHIPKGTDVFLMANGAGYLEPHIPVKDEERSPGARRSEQAKGLTGAWDNDGIGAFRPERWLKPNPEDPASEVFDPMAGPQLAFGLGPRSCFGRKFALQALKVNFAVIVWHFDLLKTPAELSGYDAVQKFAREPTQCYVRLSRVEM